MKKILSLSILSLTALLLSQQQASAWINWKFGVGLNTQFQSGGNTWVWGALRNGQPPGPELYGHFPGHFHGGHMPHSMGYLPPAYEGSGHGAPPVSAYPPSSGFQNVNYSPYGYGYSYYYMPAYYPGMYYGR